MKVYTLFVDGKYSFPASGNLFDAPAVETFNDIQNKVKKGQEYLSLISIDDIIECIDLVVADWSLRTGEVQTKLGHLGINFLIYWFRRKHLQQISDNSLHGNRKVMDDFSVVDGCNYELIANPKGTIVHWLAGNVPMLGMLSLIQGLLTKNANILKVPKDNADVIPMLLNSFNKVSFINSRNEKITGAEIVKSIAAVYIDKNDNEAQKSLSEIASVRVAWGNLEAVETIMNLRKHYGSDDVIFGPRTSFMVIGQERLQSEEDAQKIARYASMDASLFEQRGCNSPHTVFVEKGGNVTPLRFAEILGVEMQKSLKQIPRAKIAAADTLKILQLRTEYDIRGEAFYSNGIEWTVLFSEEDYGLADPCYNRTLFVRPVDDVMSVEKYCSHVTQSAGTALSEERRREFAKRVSARGIDRVPEIGKMTLYEIPWDGMFVMNEFVKWCKL